MRWRSRGPEFACGDRSGINDVVFQIFGLRPKIWKKKKVAGFVMAKTVITAALTGVLATRKQSPFIPYTAVEIAEEARRSVDAGASIVHIHARQDDGQPAWDVEAFRRIDQAVRSRCPDLIVNYS